MKPLLFILVIICGCSPKTHHDLRIIKYSANFKTTINGKAEPDFSNGYRIAYFEKYILYEVPSIKLKVRKSVITSDEIVNELVETTDTSYTYYISKLDGSVGLCYDPLKKGQPKVFSTDSIKQSLDLDNMSIFSIMLGKPKEVNINKENGVIEERFFTKERKDDADSIYRYYDKRLKTIPFTFSKSLDLEKDSKLSMIVFIYSNTSQEHDEPPKLLRTEICTSIKEVTKYDDQLIELFLRFKNDAHKYPSLK